MTMHHPKLDELVRRDPRYPHEAYEFLSHALRHTQEQLGRLPPQDNPGDLEYHVSPRELLEGVRDLALREFGLMARTVFRLWGINSTADFGELVFNLVEADLMSKTAEDSRRDFHEVYDLDEVLVRDFHIEPIREEGAP
jgi:uncharacterized repeat protein (TIGR04138 family)